MSVTEFNALLLRRNERVKLEDSRTARLMWLLAEINRDSKRHPSPFKVDDFMPRYGAASEQQKPEQMFEQLKTITAAFGGAIPNAEQ